MRRGYRIRLLVTEQEVRIDNRWRTHVIRWSDVSVVAMMGAGKFFAFPSAGQPAIGFWRRSGGVTKALATPTRESEKEPFQDAVMAFAPASVQALTPPPDWWKDQDKPRRRSPA
jgi:hypothetical protein